MATKITATAPTSYQLNSLSSFGMGYKKNLNGSFSAEMSFDSEEEAKEYLKKRAEMYYDENENELNEHYQTIDKYGSLEIDAVTASIEEIEE